MDKVIHSETVQQGSGSVTAGRAVKYDGTQATVAGERFLGIAEYDGEGEGRDLGVAVLGTKDAEAGAAVARGDELVCDAQGRLITAPGTPGEFVIGSALGSASAAGETFEILLRG